MQIGEISKRTGFSRDTIRWYEKIGLIRLDKKSRSENNYRNYDQRTLDKLIFIKQIKSFGFTLKEIADLLFLEEMRELKCSSVSEIIDLKLNKIDQKITELQNLKSKLIKGKKGCSGNCREMFEGKKSVTK